MNPCEPFVPLSASPSYVDGCEVEIHKFDCFQGTDFGAIISQCTAPVRIGSYRADAQTPDFQCAMSSLLDVKAQGESKIWSAVSNLEVDVGTMKSQQNQKA
jgi:hypothetical protein